MKIIINYTLHKILHKISVVLDQPNPARKVKSYTELSAEVSKTIKANNGDKQKQLQGTEKVRAREVINNNVYEFKT